jgi:hypothetical protein
MRKVAKVRCSRAIPARWRPAMGCRYGPDTAAKRGRSVLSNAEDAFKPTISEVVGLGFGGAISAHIAALLVSLNGHIRIRR